MESRQGELQIPDIGETDEDKILSSFDLKTKYKNILKTRFQGRQYLNKNTDLQIAISSDFVNQWVKKSRTREKIILIQVLDLLLENSVYDGLPVPDRKDRSEIEHYKHFHCQAVIDRDIYNVVLKIVKPVQKPHKLYFYSLEKTASKTTTSP